MKAQGVALRRWRLEDCGRLAELANNRKIWLNVRDRFPYPYGVEEAKAWIEHCDEKEPLSQFAIEAEGCLVGGAGFEALRDVNRIGAEVGYWLGEPYWGRGIATAALEEASRRAFAEFAFERLQAVVF